VIDFERVRGSTVVVLGDVMLDEYVWGEVERISPEAPVPVVEVASRTHVPGGAANAAVGIVALECRAELAGVVGDDPSGGDLLAAVRARSVGADAVVTDSQRPTTTKTRVVASAQQVVRTDAESRSPLAGEVEAELVDRVADAVTSAAALVVSDYGKGAVTERVARAGIGSAREAGIPIVVDTKGVHYGRYEGATVLTPNVHDAGRAANVHIESEADLERAAERLMEICPGSALLVTRGAAGMTLFSAEEPLHVPTRAQEVFDVTGAGDTVVSALAVALAAGASLADAMALANAAAGIVVGKVGTAAVELTELERELRP
jgi:D-beta-D-heptose 7-phosphate kinase/D-beta-D-heptose 1-phosphate adenosyltransferase